MLKKQAVLIKAKETQINTQSTAPPPLVDIISLIKDERFKANKVLSQNLTLLLQSVLKKFDSVVEEIKSP